MEIRTLFTFVAFVLACFFPFLLLWVWKLNKVIETQANIIIAAKSFTKELSDRLVNEEAARVTLHNSFFARCTKLWHETVAREYEIDELKWYAQALEGRIEDMENPMTLALTKPCDCPECEDYRIHGFSTYGTLTDEDDNYDEDEFVGPINRTLTIAEIVRESLPPIPWDDSCGCKTKEECNCIPF